MKSNTDHRAIHALNSANSLLVKAETFLLATFTLALVGAIFVEVICRYVFFISTAWAEELSRYLFIWLTYIGSAYALNEGGHVEIDVCKQMLEKSKMKRKDIALKGLEIMTFASTIAFLLVFGTIFWDYMMKIWVSAQTSPTMHIPMGFVYLPVFIGTLMGALHCLHHLGRCLIPAMSEENG